MAITFVNNSPEWNNMIQLYTQYKVNGVRIVITGVETEQTVNAFNWYGCTSFTATQESPTFNDYNQANASRCVDYKTYGALKT